MSNFVQTPKVSEATPEIVASNGAQPVDIAVEVPYTSYESEHKKPFIADHYELGEAYTEFSDEIGEIEGYFKDRAEHGLIANDTKTVKDLISKYEKMANIGKEERVVIKIAKLAAYVKFLKETKNIEKMVEKYG